MTEQARSRLIYALDYPTLEEARAGAERVRGHVGMVKVGLQLFVRYGPDAVALGQAAEAPVFLDLKLHDIPATVGRAVANLASLADSQVQFVTVHASGGQAMLREAHAAAESAGIQVIAVTVLTSLDQADLNALGVAASPREQAVRLARGAWDAGVRNFVCSPAEAPDLRKALGSEARIITPGVRLAGGDTHDQKRVMTPERAIAAGADMLVVGRPIRSADDPATAADEIVRQIATSLPGGA